MTEDRYTTNSERAPELTVVNEMEIQTRKPPQISDAERANLRAAYGAALTAHKTAVDAIEMSLASGRTPTQMDFDRELATAEALSVARRVFWAVCIGSDPVLAAAPPSRAETRRETH